MYSGSRDFTAKQWDISNIENPVSTYNVGDWVMSVAVVPEYETRLFTMARNGDIFIYDKETKLYIDGPFRGSSRVDFAAIKLIAKPRVPYLVAMLQGNFQTFGIILGSLVILKGTS